MLFGCVPVRLWKGEENLNPWQCKRRARHRQAEFEDRRRAYRASPEYLQQLQVDFRELEASIRSALPAVQAIRPRLGASIKCDNLAIVVSALGYGLTLRWYRPANSLGDACLYVTLWSRPVAGVEPFPRQPRKLLESRFAYDLADAGRAMFFASGKNLAYTARDLAAVCLQYVVDRARRDPLRWLRW